MDMFTFIDKGLRGAIIGVGVIVLVLVFKLVGAFISWLRTRALRDTGRAASALVQAGKRAAAEVKEGYRHNR